MSQTEDRVKQETRILKHIQDTGRFTHFVPKQIALNTRLREAFESLHERGEIAYEQIRQFWGTMHVAKRKTAKKTCTE